MAEQPYVIVSGPSKFDLMLSLFDGGMHGQPKLPGEKQKSVCFEIQNTPSTYPLFVEIGSLKRVGRSGEFWSFSGYTPDNRVEGFFSTQSRNGTIKYSD